MKYYVVADTHGFYTELVAVLEEKGFFRDKEPHKLLVCGDLFDRGKMALELQKFILQLMERGEIILVKGNHEDLVLELLENASYYLCNDRTAITSHHWHNRTIDTLCQLTGMTVYEAIDDNNAFVKKSRETPFIKNIIPAMRNYYETENYVFVHGWIPCIFRGSGYMDAYRYMENWREASTEQWERARWLNGMDCACRYNVLEPNKTIVCGHFHVSYGHYRYGNAESEMGKDADFTPFYDEGIVAIDACTAYSMRVNCIVIED